MFYEKRKEKKLCFIDDVHEINNQRCCILSGPTVYMLICIYVYIY